MVYTHVHHGEDRGDNPLFSHSENLFVSIHEETVHATENNSVEIRATVYSSYISAVVSWFYEGNPIDTVNDPRYSASNSRQGTLYTLNIARVEVTLLGRYEVVITAGGESQSDSVLLGLEIPSIVPS
jgi:hypothetical protein